MKVVKILYTFGQVSEFIGKICLNTKNFTLIIILEKKDNYEWIVFYFCCLKRKKYTLTIKIWGVTPPTQRFV